MVLENVVSAHSEVRAEPEPNDGGEDGAHKLCAISLDDEQEHEDTNGHAINGAAGEAGHRDLQALTS